jgi:hypothetical protein
MNPVADLIQKIAKILLSVFVIFSFLVQPVFASQPLDDSNKLFSSFESSVVYAIPQFNLVSKSQVFHSSVTAFSPLNFSLSKLNSTLRQVTRHGPRIKGFAVAPIRQLSYYASLDPKQSGFVLGASVSSISASKKTFRLLTACR